MSTQASPQSSSFHATTTLFPRRLAAFFARRRIAISLIGFASLTSYNVLVQRTVPYNPFELGNGWVLAAMAMLFVGLAIRSWSAGTLLKSRELTTCGPYSVTRNPLYIGSFLMMFAFCTLCRDWPTMMFVAGPMTMLYWGQVQFEEQRLSEKFPHEWRSYAQGTPRFIPRRFDVRMWTGWTAKEWLRNREYRALTASLVGLVAVYVWHTIYFV